MFVYKRFPQTIVSFLLIHWKCYACYSSLI